MILDLLIVGLLLQASTPVSAPPVVTVQQVPPERRLIGTRPSPSPEVGARQAPSADNVPAGARTDASGRIAIPRTVIEACGRAALGRGEAPAGVDCAGILRLVEMDRRRTAEGNLLRLLGEESDVTRSTPRQSGNLADADRIARDAASGNAQGEAAAIASRVRGGTPPPQGPR